MSQYKLTPNNPNHEVLVGWDPPLATFFIHVTDTTKDEDELGYDVYWVGCTPEEIHMIDQVMQQLSPYVTLSRWENSKLRRDLYRDAH